MAAAAGEVENDVAVVKQSELKLVQVVKKVSTEAECELILRENELTWKWQIPAPAAQTKGKDDNQVKDNKTASVTEETVRISWVLKAQVESAAKSTEKPEGENGDTNSDLIIHYVKRQEQPDFRFSLAQAKFNGPSNICSEWATTINDHLAKKAPQRPKSLLVIINPVSGNKKGEKVYRDKVAPVFEVAGISTEVVVTKKAKESAEILENHDLSKYDGIVSVGGDGTHTEVCGALMDKTMKAAGVEEVNPTTDLQAPSIRHGMIPVGSGNGQQLFGTYSKDVVTCAVVIALGDSRQRDLVTIHCGEKLLAYAYLLVAYGLLSQAMEIMENNRWAGPARYLAMAFLALIKRKAIEVQLDYLPADEESAADFEILSEIKADKTKADPAGAGSTTETKDEKASTPADAANAETKDSGKAEAADTEKKETSEPEGAKDEQKEASQAEGGDASEETAAQEGAEQAKPENTENKASDDKVEQAATVASAEEEAGAIPLPEGWKRVTGRFLGLDCFLGRLDKLDSTRLYMNEQDLPSGVMALSITQPCGRMEHIKFLRRLQKGELQKCFSEAGFVKVLGVKEFRVTALGEWRNSSKVNAIDWDGDMLYTPEPHFEVRMHTKVVPTFSRVDGEELRNICIQEEELKKAQQKAAQEKKQADKEKQKEKSEPAAAAAETGEDKGKPEETEEKPTENEEKPAEPETKPSEADASESEKPSEEEKKETEENLPKAEVEIKVTAAPEAAPSDD